MILLEIRDYIAERRQVPLADIAARFGLDPQLARHLVERWIDKGWVCESDSAICGNCSSRCAEFPVLYEWRGRPDQ